jgi:hypothetical protein
LLASEFQALCDEVDRLVAEQKKQDREVIRG